MIQYADADAAFWAAHADCFWGPPGEERYSHDDPDDAIERIIDDLHPMSLADIGPVEIVAVRPVVIRPREVDLDLVCERLDEEYGDPDGGNYTPSPAVTEAWAAFVAALLADYRPWTCEEVARVEVDAVQWAREHRPEWLAAAPGLDERMPSDDGEVG